MISAFLFTICVWFIVSFLGYALHWLIHRTWAGKLYEAHQAHHTKLYPPGKLISDEYLSAGSNSTVYTFLIAFSPLLILPVVLCFFGVISLASCVGALIAMATVGLMNDFIHDSFHVRNHWFSKIIPGYNRMRQLHFIHHVNMKKNFGIYSFFWDKIFKTFKQ